MYASSVAEWHYGGARGVRRLCAMRGAGYARLWRAGGRERERAEQPTIAIRRGMNPDAFHFYLDTFKNGMPPHGGFAIGLERITACFLGIANVKECSVFPRDINRVAP